MGIAVMEEIVKTVGAILKTLECPICLELLKTPVSAGCGHFFCRGCISEILHQNYRAPCPLCKRSFTRRSIQEAAQRQTVILAAETLAKTCTNLTGVNLIPLENTVKESKKSLEGSTPSAKKLKVTPKEKQDGISKKRKSCENEGSLPQADVKDSNSKMQNPSEEKGNNSDIINDECVSAKRVCYESDKEEDFDDFPSLEEIFSHNPSPKTIKFERLLSEKPLTITPTDKVSKLKTYSNSHRKRENKSKTSEELNSNTAEIMSHIEKDPDGSNLLNDRKENELSNISADEDKEIKLKNKINALKNKTNEADKYVLQEDCFLAKAKDCNNTKKDSVIMAEQEAESKENELFSNNSISSNQSPSKNLNSRRGKKKLNRKGQQPGTNTISNALPDEDNNVISRRSKRCEVSSENILAVKGKKEDDNKSYTLNETCISPHSIRKENIGRNSVDDPLGLTDTAVSVDAVKSPLTSKALSFKSPGWSRVKKVKKDFKVKKFSALPVEKNSPFLSNKQSRQSLDSVGSEQEAVSSGINRSDQSVDEMENKISDLDPQSNCDDNNDIYNEKIAAEQDIKNQNNPAGLDLLNTDKDKIPSGSKVANKNDGCYRSDGNKQNSKSLGEVNVDLEKNDELEMQKEIYEEMDCSDAPANGSHGFNVSSFEENAPCKSKVDMQTLDAKKLHSSPEAKVLTNENVTSHIANITKKKLNSKSLIHVDFTQVNDDKICQNLGNTEQDSGSLQNANILSECSGINASLSEGKEIISRKEKLVSKHAYVVYDDCSESNKDELCSNDITPKRKKTVTLKTQIAEYQRFQTQSLLDEDEGLQYVEHSQQTSQMAFNVDHQIPAYDNFALIQQQQTPYIPPQQYPPLPCGNSSTGKTKVVKRTCLTLDEIQDYFYKSNMNNSSEKICSFPFLSGQFMLDICVSEETLNVSVLKVIDQASESNNSALCPVPVLSDKGIQLSNSLFNVPSPVLPSSQTSDPNAVAEPFPYLNKLSQDLKEFKSSSKLVEETVTNEIESPMKENDALKITEAQDNPNENVAIEDCDMSEIIHFPEKPMEKADHSPQKDKYFNETEHPKNLNEDWLSPSQENALKATEPFPEGKNEIEMRLGSSAEKADSKEIFVDSNKLNDESSHKKDKSPELQVVVLDDSSDSDKEASLIKLQQCANKELTGKGKKLSRLSLKKKSKFRRTQICDSSDESDVEQESIKKFSGEKENVTSVESEEKSESTFASKKSPAFKEPSRTVGLEKAGNSLGASELEMPSTLNSILSEDAPEANASEIIIEIEDLSDKIKFLEEKLKQCGHVDEEKSDSIFPKERKASTVNSSLVHGSDSEDSNDLFPQSVPPTPPEACGHETNSSYKSSFYKTC